MSKKHGHTGHKHEIAKAHGHVPDIAPKGNKAFGSEIYAPGVKGDSMAHASHHAANAHHGMGEGMGPMGEHGTVASSSSHLGNNEMHESDKGMGEGTMDAEHEGENEHDD